jgi:predicted nuclease of predicted toxin-antitoxin system
MKLLFDQNLAPSLVKHLADAYPGSAHVHHLGLGEASDLTIWEHARDNGFTLVSKDADFVELSTVFGLPPKVIFASPRELRHAGHRAGNSKPRSVDCDAR